MRKSVIIVALLAAVCGLASEALADVVVSNLGELSDAQSLSIVEFNDVLSVPKGLDAAQSFTTGSTPAQLASVSMRMTSSQGGGGFFVELRSDSLAAPGAALATLSGNSNPSASGDYVYAAGSPFLLTANTTYWIVAKVPHIAPNKGFGWQATNSDNQSSPSGWTIGNSSAVQTFANGVPAAWVSAPQAALMSIDATAVPEPASLGLLAASLLALAMRRRG